MPVGAIYAPFVRARGARLLLDGIRAFRLGCINLSIGQHHSAIDAVSRRRSLIASPFRYRHHNRPMALPTARALRLQTYRAVGENSAVSRENLCRTKNNRDSGTFCPSVTNTFPTRTLGDWHDASLRRTQWPCYGPQPVEAVGRNAAEFRAHKCLEHLITLRPLHDLAAIARETAVSFAVCTRISHNIIAGRPSAREDMMHLAARGTQPH